MASSRSKNELRVLTKKIFAETITSTDVQASIDKFKEALPDPFAVYIVANKMRKSGDKAGAHAFIKGYKGAWEFDNLNGLMYYVLFRTTTDSEEKKYYLTQACVLGEKRAHIWYHLLYSPTKTEVPTKVVRPSKKRTKATSTTTTKRTRKRQK